MTVYIIEKMGLLETAKLLSHIFQMSPATISVLGGEVDQYFLFGSYCSLYTSGRKILLTVDEVEVAMSLYDFLTSAGADVQYPAGSRRTHTGEGEEHELAN